MISISQKSEKALSGNRELHYRIQAQFPDGSEETFTEERILYGGFSLEENSSVDGKFVIGAAVTGKFVFKLIIRMKGTTIQILAEQKYTLK